MDTRTCALWLLLCWASLCSAQPTRAALSRVGITTAKAASYQSKFGITLRVPTLQSLPSNLTADAAQTDAVASTSVALDPRIQALIADVSPKLGFTEGGYTMLIADQPAITAPASPTVMLVQTSSSQQADANKPHIIGVCDAVPWDIEGNGQVSVGPVVWAQSYLAAHGVKENIDRDTATVRVIQPPQHGKLMAFDSNLEYTTEITDWQGVQYFSDNRYEGNDSLILQVEGNGYTVQIHYFFSVGSYQNSNPDCKNKEIGIWDISSTFPQVQGVDDLFALNGLPFAGYQLKQVDVSLSFANLANGAVGETIGHTITLDDDGAGHGWFIDSTPDSNDEFLATSNPNEWIAKPDSDAAGKMDLLTVLLHEYGHALGLDHSADLHDFMAEACRLG